MGNENLLAISLKLRLKKKSSIKDFLQFEAKLHETSDVSKFITVKNGSKMSEATSNYKHVKETVINATIWQLRLGGQSNHKLSCY